MALLGARPTDLEQFSWRAERFISYITQQLQEAGQSSRSSLLPTKVEQALNLAWSRDMLMVFLRQW